MTSRIVIGTLTILCVIALLALAAPDLIAWAGGH